MSGDLEDFLRRAAQRRQAKAAQQRGGPGGKPASGSRARPQYSDSRTERLVRADEADEVLMAEIVDDEDESIAARMRRLEQAKREAAEAEAVLEQKTKSAAGGGRTSEPSEKLLTGNPADDLIRMLQQPGGIQRAILLKEILERPEDRW